MSRPEAPDADIGTLRIRCGSDLLALLRQAGFMGDYLECSDPLCQGPVLPGDDWLAHRAGFLMDAYGAWLDRDLTSISDGLRQADLALRRAAGTYDRIVLWFEHDSYDQLILARCLAQFAETPARRLEIVTVNDHPGPGRFIGLGQLAASDLPRLWDRRQLVTDAQAMAGKRIWDLLRRPDPVPLAEAAAAGIPELPFMADAIRRHCQEFPGLEDGLSLTERLILRLLLEAPHTMGEVFRCLMEDREPLPWLGDTMLRFVLESMKRVVQPVFQTGPEAGEGPWYRERLTITAMGRAVLAGKADYLSLIPPVRYLGGVRICVTGPNWRWDDRSGRLVAG